MSTRRESIDYPASDGKPMAETDVHVMEIAAALETLRLFFEDRADVYVAANNFIYYEEGDKTARFSPDVYVVHGVKKKLRRTFNIWAEKHAPSIVFEASSRSTWLEDIGNKKALCQRLAVKEYILFDPERDYLKPALQGFRLMNGQYIPIEPDAKDCLVSETIDLKIMLTPEGRLRFIDPKTGTILPRLRELKLEADAAKAEAHKARTETRREARGRREAELLAKREADARRHAEQAAQREADARRDAELATQREADARKAAEAEIERLKNELKKLKP